MSTNSQETPAQESNSLQGLSTPNLNGSASNETRQNLMISMTATEKKSTAFDVAHEIERELAKAAKILEKNEREITSRIDATLARVSALQSKGK
ncbi:hypothetical protein KGF57_003113 [Candida theae]|uniref:Uncharacterized protein n=1 Tax=Candida theae TaxID=1198502 RepID=A0AAD5FY85_9ASCO|nr:uncharacterized protein KGF57_003113 [Candida theae]KAI5957846.1 hypothetical protein KGF57_003113 [Candida theae]